MGFFQLLQDGKAQLLGLAAVGGVLGPFVDAIHNQVLLSYDLWPVSINLGQPLFAKQVLFLLVFCYVVFFFVCVVLMCLCVFCLFVG